jgi:hypothetical protein
MPFASTHSDICTLPTHDLRLLRIIYTCGKTQIARASLNSPALSFGSRERVGLKQQLRSLQGHMLLVVTADEEL